MESKSSPASALFTGYGLIGLLAGLTAMLVLVHAGRLLNFAFPVLATLVAASLFTTRRSIYAAFVWWVWLFTPLIRRLVDFQTGYHNISPVMTTPLLVTGFTLIAIARRPNFLLRRSMLPFLVLLLVFTYALILGMLTNGALGAIFDYVNWVLPVAFAVFLMMYPNEFAETQAALLFAIISGLVIISLYGIYQYYDIPPWDSYWITASQFTTAGQGYAEQVRLFGPLNSPGPYAVVLMASLVFVIIAKGPLRIAAGTFGLPAFGLALVRSAWGGFALAALYVVWRVGGKTRLRILMASFIVGVIAIPMLTVGPVADALSKRFATLDNIQQDSSFQAREGLYESSTLTAFSNPTGIGFGGIGLASKLTTGQSTVLDSGVLQIPMEFGWAAGAAFLWAVGALLLRALNSTRRTNNRIAIAGCGLFIAMLTQNIFASTFSGVIGMATWVGFALAVAPALVATPAPKIRPVAANLTLGSTV